MDVFVFFKRISGDAHRNLDESARVEYDLTPGQKGAPNVRPVCLLISTAAMRQGPAWAEPLLPSSDQPERAVDHRPRAGTRDGRCCVLQYGQK